MLAAVSEPICPQKNQVTKIRVAGRFPILAGLVTESPLPLLFVATNPLRSMFCKVFDGLLCPPDASEGR